jgi:hypothetical protein
VGESQTFYLALEALLNVVKSRIWRDVNTHEKKLQQKRSSLLFLFTLAESIIYYSRRLIRKMLSAAKYLCDWLSKLFNHSICSAPLEFSVVQCWENMFICVHWRKNFLRDACNLAAAIYHQQQPHFARYNTIMCGKNQQLWFPPFWKFYHY